MIVGVLFFKIVKKKRGRVVDTDHRSTGIKDKKRKKIGGGGCNPRRSEGKARRIFE